MTEGGSGPWHGFSFIVLFRPAATVWSVSAVEASSGPLGLEGLLFAFWFFMFFLLVCLEKKMCKSDNEKNVKFCSVLCNESDNMNHFITLANTYYTINIPYSPAPRFLFSGAAVDHIFFFSCAFLLPFQMKK